MAQRLQSEYNFSYDNLKVLKGGWNGWQDANWTDPLEYPIESDPNSIAYAERHKTT